MADHKELSLKLVGSSVVSRIITVSVSCGETVGQVQKRVAHQLDVRDFLLKFRCRGCSHFEDDDNALEVLLKTEETVDAVIADEDDVLLKAWETLDSDGAGFVDSKKILAALRTLVTGDAELDHEDLEALEVPDMYKEFSPGARALDREQFQKLLFCDGDAATRFEDIRSLFLKLGGA
eukprot:TRINITY_DN34784_c0_g1_i2.p1 TRINITY_DN34784_c0_g1~~TRINITY_DN34784_c0_g1_i2.p1  ORF type:complete len:190 (+),score=40.26 TRINITY_DN34784_c0_g1_i2:37-570(+)